MRGREATFQEWVNRVARKADTQTQKIGVDIVARVLSVARDELCEMLGGKLPDDDDEGGS